MNKLNKLIKRSDFIAIACPLTPLTKNIPNNIVIFLIMDMDLDKLFVRG